MLHSARLLLRPWRKEDRPAFAAMNADPEVRRWFANKLTREQSDAQAAKLQAHIEKHGFEFWAVEVPGVTSFAGFVGLQHVSFLAPFIPAVEAGWRLARAHWGQGYATEAARAVLAHGFGPLGLAEIVSFAVPGNAASRRVMEKIGMVHDPEGDFDDLPCLTGTRLSLSCSTACVGMTHTVAREHRLGGGNLPGPPWRNRVERRRALPGTA